MKHNLTLQSKVYALNTNKLRETWQEDLLASFVVFLVALPLSMGVAIASGVPISKAASVGLLTAIIGGILVSPISGCSLQVRGPAAGLAVMVALFIQEHGFQTLGLIIVIGGLIQLSAGFLGVGQMFRAVSPALIQGMLAGIGVSIFASQFHIMLDNAPPGTGKAFAGIINLLSIPRAVFDAFQDTEQQAAGLIGLLTIATLLLWMTFAPKKLKLLPAPLIGILIATACSLVLNLQIKFVPIPDHLSDAISWPTGAWLEQLSDRSIWLGGLSLAFVASAESLLTATAVDSMQQHTPKTQYNRELVAEGIW